MLKWEAMQRSVHWLSIMASSILGLINAVYSSRLPGGSSAGTAAAVAGSLAVLGLAEETGGSIQNPASAPGSGGIKPTFGLVPMPASCP
jgi:amidase